MSDRLTLFIGDWIVVQAEGSLALGALLVLALLSGALMLARRRATDIPRTMGD